MTDHRSGTSRWSRTTKLIGIVSIGDVVKARLDELEDERQHMVDYIQTA